MDNKLVKKLSQGEFLEKFSIKNCVEIFKKANTPIKTFNSKLESLSLIKKEYSKNFVISYINEWLINLNDYLNIQRKMTPEQIAETSIFIYNDYYYLNLADINLIFSRVKKGYYGKLYESLDGMKIIDFFMQYGNERANIVSQELDNQDSKYKIKDNKRTSDMTEISTAFKKASAFNEFKKNNIDLPKNFK